MDGMAWLGWDGWINRMGWIYRMGWLKWDEMDGLIGWHGMDGMGCKGWDRMG